MNIDEVLNKINIKKIKDFLENNKITKPETLSDDMISGMENLDLLFSLIQITYNKDIPNIQKVYICPAGKHFEYVFDGNSNFVGLYVFKRRNVFRYDIDGNLVDEYYRPRPEENKDYTYSKTNGNKYTHRDTKIKDKKLEKIRKSWGKYLMGYANKLDGRFSFYLYPYSDKEKNPLKSLGFKINPNFK